MAMIWLTTSPPSPEEESVSTTDASIGKESEKDAADYAADHVDPDNVERVVVAIFWS